MPWPMDAQGSGPGGEAPPLAPVPLTARTLRALDPMGWRAR